MAFIGIKLPEGAARVLHRIDGIPGDRVPRDHAHVTMVFLGDEVPFTVLNRVIEVIAKLGETTQPFPCYTSLVSTFPSDSDSDSDTVPIICRVNSNELHDLQARLCKELDKARVPYSKKYPEYKPHTTLAFAPSKNAEVWHDRTIPTVSWGVNEITLWGGDEGDERLVVTVPFALKLELPKRVAARYRFKHLHHLHPCHHLPGRRCWIPLHRPRAH